MYLFINDIVYVWMIRAYFNINNNFLGVFPSYKTRFQKFRFHLNRCFVSLKFALTDRYSVYIVQSLIVFGSQSFDLFFISLFTSSITVVIGLIEYVWFLLIKQWKLVYEQFSRQKKHVVCYGPQNVNLIYYL